jgi:hypothetical protein
MGCPPCKPVALSGNGFHVARLIGGISQGLAELVDGRVQPVIEIDERRTIPQSLPQFFTRYHLMRAFQKDFQNLQRVASQPQTRPMLPQFIRRDVELKWTERHSRG